MAIRRRAFERVGGFDERLAGRGDEEDWERRFVASGGRIRYVAAAGVEHRRTGEDARVRRLARAAYALGRTARRSDERKGAAPSLRGELRTLAGCAWHILRRRCAIGIVMLAHSAGRIRETMAARRG
jgi:GT2 family glycosyltransferase